MPSSKRNLLNFARPITNSEKIMHVPGSIIGNRYQIIQKLGREEIRKTYLAKDLQATGDARCAVEQLSPTCAHEANWQVIKQHLINEMGIVKRLGDHPQIPQFYNYFVEDKEFYLVREYINGDNLEQEVERKRLNEAGVIYLIQDVLRILDFLHKTNVIHRDIQPIHLVRRKQDNNFVLVNFSAIYELDSTALNLRKDLVDSLSLSNEGYTAPEEEQGESHFSSDIYALGKTAVYALTGQSPRELSETGTSWQNQCLISDKLQGILNKMMSEEVVERYSSALEVLQDLRPLLKIGQLVGGRYAIKHYLGGNGEIESYLADNLRRQYQSPCLIKQIELTHADGNHKIKIERRFAEELSILERLGYHEQIPQLWDHFVENDEFYLVQEYVAGENLAQKIAQGDLPVDEVLQVLKSTLNVLGFIHQNRIIHGNIKPSNLLIRQEDRQVMITDFDILKDIKVVPNNTVNSNQDKLNYCSPEQIAGRPTISSDLYALGMTVVEALTKTEPGIFSRDKQTGKLLWQKNILIDRRLVKIIDKMIHLDLGQRYQSANKIFNDLQKVNLGNTGGSKKGKLPRAVTIIKNRQRFSGWKISRLAIFVGLLGIACVLGSIEFAFPTIRPLYYWYQGKKLLPEQPQAALNTFTQAIDIKPQSWLAWSGRGDALNNLGRYPEALEAYAEATELNPTDFTNWMKQGEILQQLEQYTEAIVVYDRALELEQNNAELYNRKGQVLYELQDYETALSMQETALEINRQAQFLSDRGQNLLALGENHEALAMFNRIQAVEPSKVSLWQDKSFVLTALKRPQEAERVNREVLNSYNQILQKEPRNSEVWRQQADFLAQIKMYEKSINAYNRAIELKPNFYRAWLGKAKTLAQSQKNQAALTALNKALQIRPESYLAWHAKGNIYQNNFNNLNEAIASYEKGISINSNYALLWRDRGLALNQQGNYTQAIESLTRASRISVQDATTWVGLATAWDAIDQDTKALAALDFALEIQPNNPDIWSQKGLIYTKNRQYNEACDTYRQSRLAIPNSPKIMDSMRSLGCRMN